MTSAGDARVREARQAGLLAAMKVLSHPSRFRILCLLSHADSHVGSLSERLALSQPLVSYHLKMLRQAGLVRDRRDAQRICYTLNHETLGQVRALLTSLRHSASTGSARR